MLNHMPDVEQADGFADVVVARDGADRAVGQRHRVARKGHHLRPVFDVKVIETRLFELAGISALDRLRLESALRRTSPAVVAMHRILQLDLADAAAALDSLETSVVDIVDGKSVAKA